MRCGTVLTGVRVSQESLLSSSAGRRRRCEVMARRPTGRAGGPEVAMGREPRVLASGKRFHHDVQSAFVAGLPGLVATDAIE
jgi:hypothetical protein